MTEPSGPGGPDPDLATELGRTRRALQRERTWHADVTDLPSYRVAAAARRTRRRAGRLVDRMLRRATGALPDDRRDGVLARLEPVLGPVEDPLADPRPWRARHRLVAVPGTDGEPVDVVLLVVVWDPDPDDLDGLLAAVDRMRRREGVGVVVVTDSAAFHVLRRHGLLFEQLPHHLLGDATALRHRLDLLVDAWQPAAVVAVDPDPAVRDRTMALLRANADAQHPPT